MAVGAQDYIDQLLVKKYADQQVDNHENMESLVPAETMLRSMNDQGKTQQDMLSVQNSISGTGSNVLNKLRAATARYIKTSRY
ncbi:hypothetical protein J6S88_07440 [bacterium]|nr:hypothetical protein [bacterium]